MSPLQVQGGHCSLWLETLQLRRIKTENRRGSFFKSWQRSERANVKESLYTKQGHCTSRVCAIFFGGLPKVSTFHVFDLTSHRSSFTGPSWLNPWYPLTLESQSQTPARHHCSVTKIHA